MKVRNIHFVRNQSTCGTINDLALACDEQVKIGILQIESLTEVEIGQCAFKKIYPTAKMNFVPYEVFKSAVFAGFHEQRHQYIADGLGCSSRETGRDIGYTIMNNPILHKYWMLMGSNFGSLKTAPA